jgi:hypothetical protein
MMDITVINAHDIIKKINKIFVELKFKYFFLNSLSFKKTKKTKEKENIKRI